MVARLSMEIDVSVEHMCRMTTIGVDLLCYKSVFLNTMESDGEHIMTCHSHMPEESGMMACNIAILLKILDSI